MKIKEILDKSDEFLDKEVEVAGLFIMQGEISYFVDEEAEPDCKIRLEVVHPNLKEVLRGNVPACGGGNFFYYHKAIARAKLISMADSVSGFGLNNLNYLMFKVREYEFTPIS